MSREVDLSQPLSAEDRAYLHDRGRFADIKANDQEFGDAPADEESEEALERQIGELESDLNELRGRLTQLRVAREQEETRVKDNTVVNGEGGSQVEDDGLDAMGKPDLIKEIERINEDELEEGEDLLSTAGTKAQLVERIRAYRTEEDED